MAFLRCGTYMLSLDRPLLMGIVNVTPDSFSDGGRYTDTQTAIDYAKQLVEDGADILDIGGESTRPGALPVDVDTELNRILPVLDGLKDISVPLSVDTRKPEVMQEVLKAGASMINDINALHSKHALEVLGKSNAAACLMHKQGEPQTMQSNPVYNDVVAEVKQFLLDRVHAAEGAGIDRSRLVIDPGFGFGKSLEHNVKLLRYLSELTIPGVALLVGLSRKSMLGKIADATLEERIYPSIAAAVISVLKGTHIVRVHDVKATRQAFAVLNTTREYKN